MHCKSYSRASGFFSSRVLLDWVEALPRITDPSETEIRLLIAPILSVDDVLALKQAVDEPTRSKLRQRKAADLIEGVLEATKSSPETRAHVELFAWLVANERLELRFAFPSHVEDSQIYHEKYGIFEFPSGDKIAFTGSANETMSGHHRNYESIDVFRNWVVDESVRVGQKNEQFQEAWSGNAHGLVLHDLTLEVLDKIKNISPTDYPIPHNSSNDQNQDDVASGIKKWRHQDEALAVFLEARHGVLEMATGTGKTRVALKIIEHLLKRGSIGGAIISTSGNDLLDQWFNELAEYLHEFRMSVYRHYGTHHEIGRYLAHCENSIMIVSRDSLPKLINRVSSTDKARTLIVHDEVHGLGSPNCIAKMHGSHSGFAFRLGLSATPEREYDAAGSAFIQNEIGRIIYTFGLDEAIRRGILCEFDYIPLEYSLTESDRERLKKVFAIKSARQNEGNPMSDQELYRLLADVYKTAEEKPSVFSNFIRKKPALLNGTIIFAHTKEYAREVIETIHDITPNYSTYFDDDHKDRLRAFGCGELDCLVTCHRISQGIDIRHLRNVILLSSDRARLETIQRIGRCLRVDPSNPTKRATVVDFVREAGSTEEYNADYDRKEWLQNISATKRED